MAKTKERPPAADAQRYQLSNVDGIDKLDLELRPGVNVLTGENGAGKTSAIKAVARAAGDASQQLTVRRGAEKGVVIGPGVALNVGARVTAAGNPSVDLADHGALADLIDPRTKGKDARERARVAALLGLVPVQVDEALLLRLAGDDEVVAAAVEGSGKPWGRLDVAADQVRRAAQGQARVLEMKRDEARGKAQAAEAQLDGVDLDALDDELGLDELQAELRDQLAKLQRMEAEADAAAALSARQTELQATLGDEPDLEATKAAYREARQRRDEAKQTVEDLASQLETARTVLERREAELEEATRNGTRVRQDHAEWLRAKEVLDRPLVGPDADAYAAQQQRVSDLEGKVREAADADSLRAAREQLQAARAEINRHQEVADAYRAVAKDVDARVREVLAEQGVGDVTVDDGRVCGVKRDTGEVVPFEELSLGQRTRAALSVALAASQGKTFPLDPALWHALQPAARAEVAKVAAEQGVFLVTEDPTDEPGIQVVHHGV